MKINFRVTCHFIRVLIFMLYSDMAWSRSSDIYIGVIYLHMVFVFYFISPETVPFRCHFVLYMIYLSLCRPSLHVKFNVSGRIKLRSRNICFIYLLRWQWHFRWWRNKATDLNRSFVHCSNFIRLTCEVKNFSLKFWPLYLSNMWHLQIDAKHFYILFDCLFHTI
jgi:hypothetical protein